MSLRVEGVYLLRGEGVAGGKGWQRFGLSSLDGRRHTRPTQPGAGVRRPRVASSRHAAVPAGPRSPVRRTGRRCVHAASRAGGAAASRWRIAYY
eukprot:COSAG02_NODE_164_length_32230_cov_37.505587_6_plen_94_part_00